ncbi:uncharacterized protein LOC121870570 [Homarus americanus]|uniref:uncharacterized protein LOC121870570 n=1 Tax=Homarus americanus TaxID=6706 RepID=UPI001C457E14|nr:uncharacterized protein LOC121870570 [Homarus americanus]
MRWDRHGGTHRREHFGEEKEDQYMFRSGVVKALARLVATSALFRSPDFTVSLLFAHNLHQSRVTMPSMLLLMNAFPRIFPTNKQQLDNKWRAIDNIKFPDCMKNQRNTDLFYKEMSSMKDDFGEPYFRELLYFALEILSLPTSNVDERIFSKHERLLLSLPCINSITAQIILTAMSLPDVLTLPLSNLISALPWIPNKVVTTLYGLLHGDAVSVINSYGTTKPLSNVPSLPTKTEDAAASEPLLVDVSEHDQPNVVNQTLSYSDYVEGRVLEESTQLYVNDREVPDVVLLSPYAYHDKSVFTQNTKVECPDTTLSTCVTEAAGNHHTSLHGAFPSIPPEGKYLGNLFNAKDFLGSVPSTAATSLDHQQLTRMQRITATHQVSQVHQQMSQLPEQQQAVPQFYQETQQQIPHQYQHRQYTQQVPQPHQQVSQPQQMPLLHQEISQMQQILQPPLPSQLPKPVPQLQQEIPLLPPSSLQHQQHHVQHYYPQQQEEIVVLSPYFPEVQNDYTQPIGNLPQDVVIPVPASQHNRPSGVSTSEPQGYHGSVTRQGMYCGNVYQQQQLQQQKQQQQLQQQQLQHQQSHLPQGYWNGSPSLHQQPLTLRPLGNKIFGVAKPYQHHGNASMPVPPSPRVTLRQEGRGHQYPEDYNFPSSQAKGFGASQVPSTPNTKKLAYQKVPGRGGQTKLVFQHN